MNAQTLLTYWPIALPVALSALSTVHTYLDAHPRMRQVFRVVATLAGPLNLPAIRDIVVDLSRAIVAAADAKKEDESYLRRLAERSLQPQYVTNVVTPRTPAESFKSPPSFTQEPPGPLTFGDIAAAATKPEEKK